MLAGLDSSAPRAALSFEDTSLTPLLGYHAYAVPGANDDYRAVVLQPNGKLYSAGTFADLSFALQRAQDTALDFQCIPHVRANRPLRNSELAELTDEQLRARARFLTSGWARFSSPRVHSELARIKHVQSQRGKQ